MSPIYWSWSSWRRALRFLWQNITQGWNDSDCWGLDYTFALYILPRLKRFKEIAHSHPCDMKPEEWDAILDKMIKAFELVIEHEFNRYGNISEEQALIEEGLTLFAKWYQHLWD